ncbi:MAG: hypothetical protein AMXMBFR36_18310 [Acidobacteriota bacterium]
MRFGEFELDAASYRLTRRGEPVRLEPRVLELLIYLIERRTRLVSKEEIFAEVWRGQAVSDSVLTRAVYELRRALGDDPQRSTYLKTVHGRGYQFVGAVAPPEGAEASPLPAPTSPDLVDSRPGAGPTRGPGRASARAARVLLVALLVGLAGLSAWRLAGRSTPLEPAAASPGPSGVAATLAGRVAILPFAVEGGDAAAQLVALSIADLVWARLSALDGLVVREPDYAGASPGGAPDLARRARELGVEYLLSGSLATAPGSGRARVAVVLHDATTPDAIRTIPLGSHDLPMLTAGADLAEFNRAREAIAVRVAGHLGAALALPSAVPSPRHAEAYRDYLVARQRMLRLTCGGTDSVTTVLDRSLALDPEFALAWTLMGYAHYSQVWACGREERFALEALAAAERALTLDPDLAAANLLEITVLTDLGRVEEAYALAREAHGRRPRDPSLLHAQSYVLRYAGQLERSEATLRRALRLDPLLLEEIGETPMPLLYLGRYDEYLALLPAGETPYYRFYRGLTEALRGRTEEARAILAPAFRLNPNDLFARFAAGLLAILEGDARGGAEIVRQIARQRRELGTPDGEMTFKEAQLLAFAGDPEAALAQLGRAVDQGFACVDCIARDPWLAPLTTTARYREIHERAALRRRAFAERFSMEGPMRAHPAAAGTAP